MKMSGSLNSNAENGSVPPFLKWAGGKRWLVSSHSHIFPARFNRFIEPFLGSGAIFFSLKPEAGILSDVNPCLVETYQTVKSFPNEIQSLLEEAHLRHSKDYYYQVRSDVPDDSISRAARFIYLNRTCWNGLYRVNRKGEFNVPIGTKDNVLLDTDNFAAVSKLLKNVEIINCDFEMTINRASEGDLLFVDPPYTVKHNNNGFVKYNENLFSWDDQVRLRDALLNAKHRGVQIISTNADHQSIHELYDNGFEIRPISRSSVLSGDASFRGKVSELLISS
ncbi:DNA adenine methylase [Pseudomonadota bacterium]